MRIRIFALLAVLAGPVHADLRPLCPSRPGLGTPPCTVDAGHVVAEVGVADWTREDDGDIRTDTVLLGNTSVRVGLDDRTEVHVGWTPFGVVRTRDKASGTVARQRGTGDITLGIRRSLSGPDGPIAIQPYVLLPVGGSAVGAGDWGAGVIVPIAFDLGHDVQLSLSPELDAAVNESRSGRHLAYGSVVGLSAPLTEQLTGTVEFQAMRDEEPTDPSTQLLASVSLAWLIGSETQLDLGAVAGLNADSPDVEAYFGVSRRF